MEISKYKSIFHFEISILNYFEPMAGISARGGPPSGWEPATYLPRTFLKVF
jgi:hypothetical protein